MIREDGCTCRRHTRYGEKGSPWVEVEYDLGCPYHFPHAATAATTTTEE